MKLLGWMHRKLRQNSSDVFKDFTSGSTCTCLVGRPSIDEPPLREQYATYLGLSATNFPPPHGTNADILTTDQDFFSGAFLSIGTLGLLTAPFQENDDTTSFDTSLFDLPAHQETAEPAQLEVLSEEALEEKEAISMVEAIAEKEADATTESDLMAVTAHLEKALAAVAMSEEKDIASCVSSARPSGGIARPLQGFLFGSPLVDHSTTEGEAREKRASLGELFMRTRMAEVTEEVTEEGGEKEEEKSTARIGLKKIMGLRGSFRGSFATTESNKLQKILQIFHRKVYPETSITSKTKKTGTKNKTCDTNKDRNAPNVNVIKNKAKTEMPHGGATSDVSRELGVKECMPIFYCCSKRSVVGDGDNTDKKIGTGDSSGSGEHWIKTDADYLVLEL